MPKPDAPTMTRHGARLAGLTLLVLAGTLLGAWLAGRPAAAGGVPALTEAQWLSGHSADWRVGRLASNPNILVIEFPSLAAQARALNRMAALLEKRDTPRQRVLDDAALAKAIRDAGDTPETYLFGHDHPSDAMARFFSLAAQQRVPLNAQEQRLHALLLAERLLGDGTRPAHPPQALVTFTALQPDDPATPVDEGVDPARREAVLRHELSHGEFFTRPAYREQCWAFWRGLSDAQRSVWRDFLAGLDYVAADEELMVNETQAFLMHTADARVFSAELLGVAQADLDAMRLRFRAAAALSSASGAGK